MDLKLRQDTQIRKFLMPSILCSSLTSPLNNVPAHNGSSILIYKDGIARLAVAFALERHLPAYLVTTQKPLRVYITSTNYS